MCVCVILSLHKDISFLFLCVCCRVVECCSTTTFIYTGFELTLIHFSFYTIIYIIQLVFYSHWSYRPRWNFLNVILCGVAPPNDKKKDCVQFLALQKQSHLKHSVGYGSVFMKAILVSKSTQNSILPIVSRIVVYLFAKKNQKGQSSHNDKVWVTN